MPKGYSIVDKRVAEELYLLKCSLLPGEFLSFQQFLTPEESEGWSNYLDRYLELSATEDHSQLPSPYFCVGINNARLWIDVRYPIDTSPNRLLPVVTIKGEDITRDEQERWQSVIRERNEEVKDSEFPTYELISTHLLPQLHGEVSGQCDGSPQKDTNTAIFSQNAIGTTSTTYHALLTSHHLISPTKRKNLQQWSSQLHVTGFAKVGYPGCIYCEGAQEQVEEFVANTSGK
ncbi:hypothetical protein BDY19DRAFT_988937 [Irpex rosettiformis]|uniref:Uncharacterized protein n=1 Tax=Irpex rosettiformis TaxID=378272 RepID=A0ACB8UL74_9APHY|nr:hypothetical protein BDY19DRAFT_988937 [Irpex rosettiformis]